MGLHYLVRIIHECRREAFEIEGRVGVSAVRRGGRTGKTS